jgi:hypothetical protein
MKIVFLPSPIAFRAAGESVLSPARHQGKACVSSSSRTLAIPGYRVPAPGADRKTLDSP